MSRFKKKRSPHTLVFLTEDPEEWFIDCIEYKSKSGVVIHDDIIIMKDMPDWIDWHKRLEWEEV